MIQIANMHDKWILNIYDCETFHSMNISDLVTAVFEKLSLIKCTEWYAETFLKELFKGSLRLYII